jgi:hypothetical protein
LYTEYVIAVAAIPAMESYGVLLECVSCMEGTLAYFAVAAFLSLSALGKGIGIVESTTAVTSCHVECGRRILYKKGRILCEIGRI